MARKKHIRSHKATAGTKGAKTAGKVSIATNKIAATVAAVAVTGAFGAGAYALTQDATAFNPDGFASAYGKSAQDSQKGYQATAEQTDAQANRHDDASQDKEKSAEANPNKDAFSDLPNNGSGTTAVAVDANAKPGTSTVVNDGKGDSGTGDGDSGNSSGPVIDNGGEDGSGDGKGDGGNNGTPSGGSDNSGGGSDTPSAPDTPSNNGGGSGGNGGGGSNSGGVTGNLDGGKHETPEVPDPIPDRTEIPSLPGEGSSYLDAGEFRGNVNEDGSAPDVKRVNVSEGSDYSLYRGQKNITEWMLFSTLTAQFTDCQGQVYVWAPTKEEYESGYDLFKIDKVYYIEDTEDSWLDGYIPNPGHEISLPLDELPINVSGLYITVKYRFSSSSQWLEYDEPIICNIDYGCTYVVGSDDAHTVLNTYKNHWPVFLSQNLDKVLPTIDGAVEWYTNEYGRDEFYQRKLLLSWHLDGEEVSSRYAPKLGKHVVTAGRTIDFDYEKYRVKPVISWLDSEGHVDFDGGNLVYLQTLVGTSVETDGERTKIEVPYGIEEVQFDTSLFGPESADVLQVDDLVLSSTVKAVKFMDANNEYFNPGNHNLKVTHQFVVDKDNEDLASIDGILANKDMSEYLGVPLDREELEIPEGVEKVDLSDDNQIKRISIAAKSYEDFPSVDWGKVSDCTIELKKSVAADFMANNEDALNAARGNTIVIDGVPAGQISVSYGMIVSNGVLTQVANNGMEYVKLRGVKGVAKGCFESNHDAKTLILDGDGEYVFEKGCFNNSGNLKLIVCNTQQQEAALKSRLASDDVEGISVVLTAEVDGCAYFVDETRENSGDETAIGHAVLTEISSSVVNFDSDELAAKLSNRNLVLDAVAPFACQDNSNLISVKLGQSINTIMVGAFLHCDNLEDVLIDNRGEVTLETDAFKDCMSMSALASNASSLNVPSDFGKPADSCMMYCLEDNSWFYPDGFTYFNADPSIVSYSFEQIDAAGDVALYACSSTADGSTDYPWLCVRASTVVSGEITLPETTTEFFVGSFKYCNNVFTVNWVDLSRLRYIDDSAFYDSGVAGDVAVGDPNDEFIIDDSAFGKCGNLETVTVNADSYLIGFNAFNSCTGLKRVYLGVNGSISESTLYANVWNDCANLESIEFKNSVAPGLVVTTPDKGFGFQLNASWGFDEEPSKFKVIVPDDVADDYLEKWIYSFAGYLSYDSARNAVYNQCAVEAGNKRPTEAAVNERLKEILLKSQNHLLRFFGKNESDKLIATPLKDLLGQEEEQTPTEEVNLVPAPGINEAEGNAGDGTTENLGEGKGEVGVNGDAGNNDRESDEAEGSIDVDPGDKTDSIGGDKTGSGNSGSADKVETGPDEFRGEVTE